MKVSRVLWLLLLGCVCLPGAAPLSVFAQQPARTGSLRVTVLDLTSLPISGAVVTVTGPNGFSRTAPTNDRGVADIDALPQGTFDVRIESPGFEPFVINALALRPGARVTRDVVLKIAGFVEEISVAPPDADRALNDSFTTTMTADEIAALPEDPDELAAVLQQLAGLDADIRVDGFSASGLPPGTQIQSIRIRYDAAGGDNSSGGARVEIRTQPGGDRWRTNGGFRMRDEALNARNVFATTHPNGQTHVYNWTVAGPLVKNRTGLTVTVDHSDSNDVLAIRAATPSGLFSSLVPQPSAHTQVQTRLEHALTPAQQLRVDLRESHDNASNQGLGEVDLPERAYTRISSDGELRVGHNATLPRQMVNDARLQVRWRDGESDPVSTAIATRVSGAFSQGGAQIQGGRKTREVELEDELTFTVHTRHQISAGGNTIGGRYSGDEWRNAGGTFAFASLDTFAPAAPAPPAPTSFTQRLGDPRFAYSLYRFGAFVQDDFRVRKNLVLHLGVREDLQTRLSDWANFGPRLGVNWTPSPRLRTALRASYSISYNALQGSTYEQTVLVNGERQRDLVIDAPSYPDPFLGGAVAANRPPGVIRADPDIIMPSNRRWQVGFDQPIRKIYRVRATYSRQSGHDLFRAVDLNAPIDGVRPDASVTTLTELQSSARSLNQSLEFNFNVNYLPRRLSVNATYVLGQQRNETDGALTLPANSFDLTSEWGPARNDVRHRFDAQMNSDLWFGFRASANVHAQSASPYTITTGYDTNGDGVNNERPAGVGRNSARGAASKNLDTTLTYQFGMGQRPLPPLPANRTPAVPARPSPLVRFELYLQANNVLNNVNLQGFSGVLTSPLFGRPTSASAARRLIFGSRFYF